MNDGYPLVLSICNETMQGAMIRVFLILYLAAKNGSNILQCLFTNLLVYGYKAVVFVSTCCKDITLVVISCTHIEWLYHIKQPDSFFGHWQRIKVQAAYNWLSRYVKLKKSLITDKHASWDHFHLKTFAQTFLYMLVGTKGSVKRANCSNKYIFE